MQKGSITIANAGAEPPLGEIFKWVSNDRRSAAVPFLWWKAISIIERRRRHQPGDEIRQLRILQAATPPGGAFVTGHRL
jgi:hypothetical protein